MRNIATYVHIVLQIDDQCASGGWYVVPFPTHLESLHGPVVRVHH